MLPVNPVKLGIDNNSAVHTFSYRAFGLNICSELELNGVLPNVGVPDVHVRLGGVPERLENAAAVGVFYEATTGQLLLNIEHVGRFLISSGNEIVIQEMPAADHGMILLVLLGSAFGALLHQRKVLALHASAIGTPQGAVVFAGASGYGKSTLAGAFHQRGFPVLADDVCPISTSEFPSVLPANPFLMLWADSASRLGINKQNLRRARSGLEKYILPLGEAFAAEPIALYAVYLLEPCNADEFSLTPIRGLQKIKRLGLTVYRPLFAAGMSVDSQYFSQIGATARCAKVTAVKRPSNGFRVEELADLLAADFAA